MDSNFPDHAELTQAEAIESVNEKYLQMVMDRQQAGREVPAKPVYADVVGDTMARTAVEQSQRLMKQSRRQSFSLGKTFSDHYERIFGHA